MNGAAGNVSESRCLVQFWRQLDDLGAKVKDCAEDKYNKWREQGFPLPCTTPRIEFKKRIKGAPIYGARISQFYRAYMVVRDGNVAVWYWVGEHPRGATIPTPPA